jgi:hypothetical protein
MAVASMTFREPAFVGDEVTCEIIRIGTTSNSARSKAGYGGGSAVRPFSLVPDEADKAL